MKVFEMWQQHLDATEKRIKKINNYTMSYHYRLFKKNARSCYDYKDILLSKYNQSFFEYCIKERLKKKGK